ncbi:hypothetical protein HYFRA_00011167 [Hymenoscyphus fraxineus]|uniref:Uncharacterized protein n=1 Tax=Hymenoscyphus fraxineus TaxID=746836 RepID=A0A9N9L1Y6_9HELO|nr:hypothetical protein HYFRA_00011167 [Hymenoscyphus fraxineus]
MDFIKKAVGSDSSTSTSTQQNQHSTSSGGYNNNQHTSSSSSEKKEGEGGFLSGITEKLNGAAGGGKESEKNEDYLDKGVDFVQQHILGQGPQDNESAIEQAKDEKISDFIRGKYKDTTGKEVPIEDKKTTWG